ncbi:MAG TPA: ABC transporter ATP-binding protein [Vicinamibacteria bacterium]|nr:ABC transporter ATP-binding protein [Vicinamibacteria bacterium]
MNSLSAVIEFESVTKTFSPGLPGEFTAIRDVSFRIDDVPDYGEFVAIVGPSGCGKSTILNLIQGFADVYPPSSGAVRVRGHRVTGPGRDRGMIFQKYSSFPHLTVLHNVTFGLELDHGEVKLPRSEREALARQWIAKVGLQGHEHKYPHQLSGGQQQRVAIARTLVLKPKIILMDEPFSALDEPTRLDMQRLIMALWHEVQATVLIVTHSIAEAVYLGDRVWVMAAAPGRIAHEFRDGIPKTRDADPLTIQEMAAFKEAVAAVGEAFRKVDTSK